MEHNDDLQAYTAESLAEVIANCEHENGSLRIKAMLEESDGQMVMVTITTMAKGWVTVEDADGNPSKVRAGSLYPVESEQSRAMVNTLARYRQRYVSSVANSGKKSLHCGDSVAEALEYQALEDLYEIAGNILEGWTAETLHAKYRHLNIGAQRMNVGNRIRAAYKRGDEEVVRWVEDHLGDK